MPETLTDTRVLVDEGVEAGALLVLAVGADAAQQRRLSQLQPRSHAVLSVGGTGPKVSKDTRHLKERGWME